MNSNPITHFDDLIDSRNVIARIAELESEQEELSQAFEACEGALVVAAQTGEPQATIREALDEAAAALAEWQADYGDELAALRTLEEEAEGYAADWHHGEVLVRDSYFVEHAQQLADDLGVLDANASWWPLTCIDWDKAARELQMDYTPVEFAGVTYWMR